MRRGQRVWKAGNVSGNLVSNNAVVRRRQGDHEFSPRVRDVAAAIPGSSGLKWDHVVLPILGILVDFGGIF